MNFRIGEGIVRCRISCEELELLLTGKQLEETMTLAGKPVLLTLDPSGKDLELIYEEGRIGLRAPKDSLKALDRKGQQKSGIVSNTGGATLSLQVDLKTYSRKSSG